MPAHPRPAHPLTRRLLGPTVALAVCAGISALFIIDYCDLLFDCGCRSLWAGAAEHCNIHDPTTRDCPWCAAGLWGVLLPLGGVIAGQAVVLLAPGRLALRWRIAAALAAALVIGGGFGLGFGLAAGYW